MAKLQETLIQEFGKRTIAQTQMPEYFETGLNPQKHLRPYQIECMKYFLTYMEEDFDGKSVRPHLLFHMATGSGKTMQMVLAMLYLYEKGYRNFLFFVGSTNIVEKTKDNFLNPASSKYLFAPNVSINGRRVEIREVRNFQGVSDNCINLCLTTIQGLHSDLNSEKENAITYEDFSDKPIVMIADEAHHLNAETKKASKRTKEEKESVENWEKTISNIFNKDNGSMPNVLLEFTATMDLSDVAIAQKYEDKIIFDYDLKHFREDGYSKDVETFETDADPMDRALQAMIISQYKRKLFVELKQDIKPVIMLKSKKINENEANFESFKQKVRQLSSADIDRVRNRAVDDLRIAFDYFAKSGITDENLILELQNEFSEERLLLVDGNNITPEKQRLLNSLEEKDNDIRAVFAVDMLNEGWDVLNLYDIVRLFDTRDAKGNKPGKTTMQEAQLIGRGARYMSFSDPNNNALEVDKRKYDGDAKNPYRVVEKLHYHSAHNPRYIQELRTALIQTGIIPDNRIELDLFMKDDFKETNLFNKGIVFVNEQKKYAEVEDDGTIGQTILNKVYTVNMPTGKMRSGQMFGDNAPSEVLVSLTVPEFDFITVGKHVIRSAMNYFSTFAYDSLKELYPHLKSCREFVSSEKYLAKLQVKVVGKYEKLDEYSQADKLYIAKNLLAQLEPILRNRGKSYKGTKLFVPKEFKEVFRDSIQLRINIPEGSRQEFGQSQLNPVNTAYTMNLMEKEWYAYNDNYGTSEEKALVKYVDSIMLKLKEKYDEVYLVRNEKDVRIFSFDEGRPFEPDYVMFLRIKGSEDKYDNIQIFIEPKGNQLLKTDKWKEDFLRQIQTMGEVQWMTASDDYNVWGLPFYNENQEHQFDSVFKDEVINYENQEETAEDDIPFLIEDNVPPSKRFATHLPVYPLRAACGYFDDCGQLQDEDAEGWIDACSIGRTLNEKMFVVHAEGDSMEPKIYDGELCVFDATGAGSREGKIVLCKAKDKMDRDASSFTIKKYHSEKVVNEDGRWTHSQIILSPFNSEYNPIVIDAEDVDEDDFRIYGEFVAVIK